MQKEKNKKEAEKRQRRQKMGGQKFQYDESGGTFFYFILSFLALILIPATMYFWPKKRKEGKR